MAGVSGAPDTAGEVNARTTDTGNGCRPGMIVLLAEPEVAGRRDGKIMTALRYIGRQASPAACLLAVNILRAESK